VGGGRGRCPSFRLFSDTTLRDFSKTFQSLIVLSEIRCHLECRAIMTHRCVLTIRGEDEMSRVLSGTPLDLVDFLLYFKRFEIVKFRFM
jgi:hypothetical protein